MLVENCQYEPTPSGFGVSVGGDPLEFAEICGIRKLESLPELLYSIACMIQHLAVLVQCRLVTDGWTDAQRQHIPR